MSAAVLVPQKTPVVLVVDDVDANGELIEEGEPVASAERGHAMSADQLIQQITNALFALVGVGAVVVAIRRPRRANVNAALREAIGQCRAWRMAAGSDQRKSTS